MFYEESDNIYDDLMILKNKLVSVGRSGRDNTILAQKEIKFFSHFFKSESQKKKYIVPDIFKYCKTSSDIFIRLQKLGGYAERDNYISEILNPIIDMYEGDGYASDADVFINLKDKMISDTGSYALVYKFEDPLTKKKYAFKSLKKHVNTKEIKRFEYEYEIMSNLNSNNIVEVYKKNRDGYIMEYCDSTLDKYISTNNTKMTMKDRERLIIQLFRTFVYLHRKDILHRDVSYRNILIKEYEDYPILKVSDFGLVKTLESKLTSEGTDVKGSLADPWLRTNGFKNYNVQNEIYSLAYIVNFILYGKYDIRFDKISNEEFKIFLEMCINPDLNKRFNSVLEMAKVCLKKLHNFI